MRVIVCGDRNWSDIDLIEKTILGFPRISTIIEGEARGADYLARLVGEGMGLKVLRFPAKWEEYKEKYPVEKFGMKWKSAGTDRNQQMLDEGKPDFVIAFHDWIFNSKGTKDMILRARKNGLPCVLICHKRRNVT